MPGVADGMPGALGAAGAGTPSPESGMGAPQNGHSFCMMPAMTANSLPHSGHTCGAATSAGLKHMYGLLSFLDAGRPAHAARPAQPNP